MADSIASFQAARDLGHITSEQLVSDALDAIARDAHLNAWCALASRDDLIAQARASDARHARGQRLSVLDGVTVGLKDNVCAVGLPATAASLILSGFQPPYDAEVVRRLRDAGAIIVGKHNMDEFGMGSSSERSAFGPVHNPASPGHIAGGSSGGSAAAVAAGHCLLAIGSDTGGSIRQPAAHCGVVGLKPTYGRVSRRGLIAYASSLDQLGPITRTAADAALALDIIAGRDPLDATSHDAAPLPVPTRVLRVGVPRALLDDPALDPSVRASIEDAIERLGQRCTLVDVTLDHMQLAVSAYYLIASAEASSNLSRYDGVRFGHRAQQPTSLPDLYERSRGEGFGEEVKRRILLGTFVLSEGYYDAYYLKAQQVRTLICRTFEAALSVADVLVLPVTPTPAPTLGSYLKEDTMKMYLEDAYTVPVNLAGLPAISVPGVPAPDGRTIGVQLVAAPMAEATLIAAASMLEEA
jgi:aspartyl-tRNA(Asn)/glutamyl-tRNA(Gln) amidotransferase subunit A